MPSVSQADTALLDLAQNAADEHVSGGDFDMVALWAKGSDRKYGHNKLQRSPKMRYSTYPDIMGVHAELDLWFNNHDMALRGGRLAIAGKKSRNGAAMPTTRPCMYCAAILYQAGISHVIFRDLGAIRKFRVADLV